MVPSALVLLHGLGRGSRSMRPLARDAERLGWRVLNVGYPSRRLGVQALAAEVGRSIAAFAPGEPLHFVTHSMGGILVRAAVAMGAIPAARVRRVVMLAPPNRGSEVADALARSRLYRLLLGPAGQELGTGAASVPLRLPAVPFECGVIAGARSLNPLLSRLIPGANDGKVSVTRAQVDGMRAWLVVPHGHTFLMHSRAVRAQTFHFLLHGSFA
ncbi:MAG TPA: hypothetical protein VFY16_09720 [Gemmatimonadaceae bacterium]|nr:hypothetical protein [Gemmatimonadaceae bacterium]